MCKQNEVDDMYHQPRFVYNSENLYLSYLRNEFLISIAVIGRKQGIKNRIVCLHMVNLRHSSYKTT